MFEIRITNMELNNIQLSGELLRALYGHSLVGTEPNDNELPPAAVPEAARQADPPDTVPLPNQAQDQAPDKNPPVATRIQFLGNNGRRFTVLVRYPGIPHCPDEAFTFLANLLKACQISVADVAIVNLADQQFSLEQLMDQLAPLLLVSFGDNHLTSQLPPADTLVPAGGPGFRYLLAPPIEQLNQQTEAVKPLKKQLWAGILQLLQS